MNLAWFVFLIGIAPAYLNEETKTSTPNPIETEINRSDIQAQEGKDADPKENHKCPSKDIIVRTLVFVRDHLLPADNKKVDVDILKDSLGTFIRQMNDTIVEDSDILNSNIQSRPKKEVLRVSQMDESNPRNILTGKVSLEYQVPEFRNGDCQTLLSAILNAINAAYMQMNAYCAESGKCKLSNNDITPPQISIPPWPPQHNVIGGNVQNPQTNEELNKYILSLLGTYPQNIDIMTILQNYRPNSTSINVNGNNNPSNEQVLANTNLNPNGQTQSAKNSVLEIYTILDKPSGYTVNQGSIPADINAAHPAPVTNASLHIMYGAGSMPPPGQIGSIQMTQNITGTPSVSAENLILKHHMPSTGSTIMNSHTGDNSIPLQGYQHGVSNVINRNVINNVPNQVPSYNVLQPPQNAFQIGNNPLNAYLHLQQNNPQLGSMYTQNPLYAYLSYPQAKYTLQNYNNNYQNPLHLKPPVTNQFGYLPNQRNMLLNPQINQGISYNTAPGVNNLLQNLNNTVALQDLYRLTSMTNGPKLNIAPNKNGMIELTFTLQRPKALQYNPVYYVKYILPYQTYMYNLQNLLQTRPFLRNNPAQLYQELLAVANMTESSQDLKDLEKHEITKLVATNGALVKAKVLGDGKDSVDTVITDEVQNILKLSSKLGAEGMLNATKLAVDNIEAAMNNGSNTTKPEANVINAPIADVLNRSVNSRTLGMTPLYTNQQYLQQAIRNNRYNSPYANRNVYPGSNVNRQVLFG
ncbi:uncharacterized protein LOC123703874 [Colias croceus]|uniref:uncharacterized protein LOC123703874 n=1 Tax=Colias crocea TaxID=72248 RepID=UPI001E280A7E|nr:uncharacterized protein LOC123703874 [Colias croceus]